MPTFHKVDDDGDVDLILPLSENVPIHLEDFVDIPTPTRQELATQRILDKVFRRSLYFGTNSKKAPAVSAPSANLIHETENEKEREKEQETEKTPDDYVRIRVSSKHLSLASLYFRQNLRSRMHESSTLKSNGYIELPMSEMDPEAMLIVMNIIHVRFRQLPDSITFETLTKLAVVVDYLQCLEAIEPFSDRWIESLKNVPTTYSPALIQWLCISRVFKKAELFRSITGTMIWKAKGPIQTLGLPIGESIVDKCPESIE